MVRYIGLEDNYLKWVKRIIHFLISSKF